MCIQFVPLLASLALTGAGAGVSYAGQQKAKSAMNNATLAELARQKAIQDKSSAEFAQSLAGSKKEVADTQIQEGETQKEQGYRQTQAVPINVGNQQLVGGQNAALNLQDSARQALSNRSRAKLGSYDKWQLDQAIKNLRSSQQQALFNQEAQRSQAVLPLELQDASHKGDSLQALGTGLGLLGSLVGMGATSGLGMGASAASGTALTAPQLAAINTGFGPVSTGFANSIYGTTQPLFNAQNALRLASQTGTSLSGLYGMGRKY